VKQASVGIAAQPISNMADTGKFINTERDKWLGVIKSGNTAVE
jgi:hypothetical protein